MFESLKSLGKAAIGLVVEVPVALIADTATLCGSLTDKERPYTATALQKIARNISDATDHD